MAATSTGDLQNFIEIAQSQLDNITYQRSEQSQQRAIYELHGLWRGYEIRLKEIYSSKGRMYSYYVLRQRRVIVGFDNYPDRPVLKQKYGQQFNQHLSDLIPHKHNLDKQTV